MAKKHSQHHEEHADESWLIPYADLLTLLLALFIVLYASSNLDSAKFKAIMSSFYSEFNGGASPIEELTGGTGMEPGALEGIDWETAPTPTSDAEEDSVESPGVNVIDPQLEELYNSINGYIDANGMGSEMKLKISKDGLLITLASDIWFQSGSATVSDAMKESARTLADMLAQSQSQRDDQTLYIIITGHTDNRPISNGKYPSNWALSVDRAVQFMAVLQENDQLDPRTFQARGYGEYEPLDTNDTEEGRQRNRRVEVMVTLQHIEEIKGSLDTLGNGTTENLP